MSDPLSTEELNAIEKRASQATPGPWRFTSDDDQKHGTVAWYVGDDGTNGRNVHVCSDAEALEVLDDAAFIAAARTDVPRLLAEVGRLSAIVEKQGVVICDGLVSEVAGEASKALSRSAARQAFEAAATLCESFAEERRGSIKRLQLDGAAEDDLEWLHIKAGEAQRCANAIRSRGKGETR